MYLENRRDETIRQVVGELMADPLTRQFFEDLVQDPERVKAFERSIEENCKTLLRVEEPCQQKKAETVEKALPIQPTASE